MTQVVSLEPVMRCSPVPTLSSAIHVTMSGEMGEGGREGGKEGGRRGRDGDVYSASDCSHLDNPTVHQQCKQEGISSQVLKKKRKWCSVQQSIDSKEDSISQNRQACCRWVLSHSNM